MSIVDPLRRRAVGSGQPTSPPALPREAHLRGPENYDTPRSKDIFNVARRLEAGRPPLTPKKPSLGVRLLQISGLGKKAEDPRPDRRIMAIDSVQGHHTSREHQRATNPVHRQLPEEHLEAWQKAEEDRKRASVGNSSSSSTRKLKGPVPRRPNLPETERLSRTLDTAFLSPVESEVYNIMRRVGRCATFTPFTSSASEDRRQQIMLVHPSNVEPLRHIQILAGSLSDQDKHTLLRSLQGLLISNLIGTLKTILFQPDIFITSSSQSGRGYSPPEVKVPRRPESWEFFTGKINPSWEQIHPVKKYVLYDQGNDQGQEYKRKPSIFKSFEQREFMPDVSSSSDSDGDPGLYLRGGGEDGVGEDRRPFPFEKSVRVYVGHFTRTGPPAPLADEERVPRTLF